MIWAACRALVIVAVLCLFPGAAPPASTQPAEISSGIRSCYGEHDAAFVMLNVRAGQWTRLNPERCAKRFSPCSTFKIPNALIGLDTGAIHDADHLIKWDGTPNSREAANRDHTLRSATRESIVWYFQELANRVGMEQMQRYIDGFDYGNRDLTGGLTRFWLDSSLVISPDEQVEFLDRFRRGDLPCNERSLQIVRELIEYSREGDTIVRGKTGSDGNGLGWYVGWVEKGDDAYVFAACASGEGVWGIPVRDMTFEALAKLDVLPKPAATAAAN